MHGQIFRKGWDGLPIAFEKILFCFGADEYLERLGGKIRKCFCFILKHSKISDILLPKFSGSSSFCQGPRTWIYLDTYIGIWFYKSRIILCKYEKRLPIWISLDLETKFIFDSFMRLTTFTIGTFCKYFNFYAPLILGPIFVGSSLGLLRTSKLKS